MASDAVECTGDVTAKKSWLDVQAYTIYVTVLTIWESGNATEDLIVDEFGKFSPFFNLACTFLRDGDEDETLLLITVGFSISIGFPIPQTSISDPSSPGSGIFGSILEFVGGQTFCWPFFIAAADPSLVVVVVVSFIICNW
uniref:Uncharacterized protein n=1 Tax=Romanomermis culicivorax TaxID=13658 RepID=A0A915JUC2_ROMCU